MLNEETLILFAATGACALLILAVLELVTPSRLHHFRRKAVPERDPWRRARTGPVSARPSEAIVPREPAVAASVETEPPPIERLLLSQAETLTAFAEPEPGPVISPLPPPRKPAGFEFLGRRPATSALGSRAAEAGPIVSVPPASTPVSLEAGKDDPPPDQTVGSVGPGSVELWGPVAPPLAATPRTAGAAPSVPPPVQMPEPPPAGEPSTAQSGSWPQNSPLVDRLAEFAAAALEAPEAGDLETKLTGPTAPSPTAAQADRGAPPGSSSAVERCHAFYEAKQYIEALAEAVPVLENVARGTLFLDPLDVARLWGLVGLARQAVGDHDGARTAFKEAITVAPGEERATWQRHLGALALHVGQQLVLYAQGGTGDGEQRVIALQAAIMWLDGGRTASPNDTALREAAVNARSTLWLTYEQVVSELIQRQDYNAARRLLRQALADEECPTALEVTLRDLVAMTYSSEVGQLTAEAIRRIQEGKQDDAVATLDRAEALLATIPEEGLPGKRRHELERRLWWSYTKVGIRRLDGGMYEQALGPLLHALHFGSVGPERLDETKRPLARALESIAEVRSPLIQRLAADGDRDGALVLCEKLWTFLRSALERGMTRDELTTAFNRTQALFEKLGKPRK